MDRRSVIRAFTAAASVALVGLALGSCSNPIDIVAAVTTEVKAANKKFLVVSEIGPASNATLVSPSTSLWVQFDRDIDTSTITPGSVTIVSADGTSSGWTPVYDSTTRTLSIYPDALDSQKKYTITVTGILKGKDGSELQANYVWSFTTKLGPSGSVVINDNAGYSTSNTISLSVTVNAQAYKFRWSTAKTMITDDQATGSTAWYTITGSGPYAATLTGVDGNNTIYAQFWNSAGDDWTSSVVPKNDSIVLDRVAPTVTSFTIQNGTTYAASTAVTLYNNVADATSPIEMRFQNFVDGITWSAWENYSATKAWPLSAAGTRVVNAQFRDKAGNSDNVTYSDSIIAGTPTMYTYMNYHVYAAFGSVGVWWSALAAPDIGTDTYYVSYRDHSPVGSWTFAQSSLTAPIASAPMTIPVTSEKMYDFAVQIGNSTAGWDPALATYSNAVDNFTANVVIVYNPADKVDYYLAPAIYTVLKNIDGWMTKYSAAGALPTWSVMLIPERDVSTRYSSFDRIWGYPLIVTPGIGNYTYPEWVQNLITPGRGVIAMGEAGAYMLDVVNEYWLKWYKTTSGQPNQIGWKYGNSRLTVPSDWAFARTAGNAVWTSPLYWTGSPVISDMAKVLTGKVLLARVSALLPYPTDPVGGAVYSRESSNGDYANTVRQGRFLQYGYDGLSGTGYPFYMWPFWVNLVNLMSAY